MSVTTRNHLSDERSAYLQQHKDNPIHWYSWGPEAIQAAQDSDRPIFLSIGYSSCHWCHVMANESFSDDATAQYLNDNYICIKVDREEHPEIDQFYQACAQASTGRGGWPLSAFIMPDGKPFFIGTYFPKESQSEMPSFMQVCQELKDIYSNDRSEMLANAQKVTEMVDQKIEIQNKVDYEGEFVSPVGILQALSEYQDKENGGYGEAPKFPTFSYWEWAVEHMLEGIVQQEHGQHIVDSLEAMLCGGLYDHARGGVHRYSVDKKWLVPHFEKMLYDQAGLLRVLPKLGMLYPSPLVYDAILQTIDYIDSEMRSDSGHLFSAQDADSEGHEGLYFTYSQEEFEAAIASSDEELAAKLDSIAKWVPMTQEGNFERGLNVISLDRAHKQEFYQQENWDYIRKMRQAIQEDRKDRIPPLTDTKGVASWNFMLLSGLCDVIHYCKIAPIRAQAMKLLEEITEKTLETFVYINDEGKSRIKHATTGGDKIGLLEDYATFAECQLRLFEVTTNPAFKENGLATIEHIFDHFYDDQAKCFRTISRFDQDLRPFPNLEAPLFDQSFRSPAATVIGLTRKWSVAGLDESYLERIEPLIDYTKQFTLQNPLGSGEALRSVTYPHEAYKVLKVPQSWAQNEEFVEFMPFLSSRFAIDWQDSEKWEICGRSACEFSGSKLGEFLEIFQPPKEDGASES